MNPPRLARQRVRNCPGVLRALLAVAITVDSSLGIQPRVMGGKVEVGAGLLGLHTDRQRTTGTGRNIATRALP